MAVDFSSLSRNTQGALATGGVALVLSLFPSYVRASVDGGEDIPGFSYSAGSSAWTGYATLGMLLVLVAVAVVALKAFAPQTLPAEVPWTLVAFATAALGTLLVVLRALTASGDAPGVSVGPGWSGWLLFVALIALTAFTALSFRDSGEKLPDVNRGGGDTPPPAPPA